jgi:hypothetical protein
MNLNALFSLESPDAVTKDYYVLTLDDRYLKEEIILLCCLAIRTNRVRESNCTCTHINYIIYKLIIAGHSSRAV